MKEDQLLRLYTDATVLARATSQTIGDKRDYYITLEQLMDLISGIQDVNNY